MPEEFIVGPAHDYVGPLHLTFEARWYTPDPDLPEGLRRIQRGHWESVRPVEAAVVIAGIEEIYLAAIREDLPPARYWQPLDWAARAETRSLTPRLRGIELGSPLHVFLELPAPVYVPALAFFAYGLARVFGAPYRAAAIFERARQEYFDQRLDTAEAKDRWLDYKARKVKEQTDFKLRAVDLDSPGRKESDERPIESDSIESDERGS